MRSVLGNWGKMFSGGSEMCFGDSGLKSVDRTSKHMFVGGKDAKSVNRNDVIGLSVLVEHRSEVCLGILFLVKTMRSVCLCENEINMF